MKEGYALKELYDKYLECSGVCTDTRKIEQDCIFFALKGDHFNGNEFADQALAAGAKYVVVDEGVAGDQRILVDDVLTTLQELANHHRNQLTIPVIGITGSNGKTTTKELIREVLLQQYKVYATVGNLNNHIGVPLSLLALTDEHEIAIIEMGANGLKEIEFLCNICDPDLGLITNIGYAHIEGFGSYEGVLKTKSELYEHIRAKGGKIFINASDEVLMKAGEGIEQLPYSIDGAEPSGRVTKADPFIHIEWRDRGVTHPVAMQLVGSYNLPNAMAAVAIGLHFNVTPENICTALAEYTPDNNRSQIKRTERNVLIMDAYNANPTSMSAALKNLATITAENKLAVLGDMLELGDTSAEEHQKIVDELTSLGLQAVLVGKEFAATAPPYPCFDSTDDAQDHLKELDMTQHTILLKGSRGIQLEKLVDLF